MVSFSLAGPHTHDTHMHTMASQHSSHSHSRSHSRRRRDFRHAAQARAQRSLAVLLVPLLLLLATVATTQAVRTFTNQASAVASNEVFLRGKYIEVGIHNVASYGTENNPPSSTHFNGRDHANNKWNRGVGFIADYNKDGFASGSPTKYSGDYFIPGTPLEGWSVDLKTSTGSGYTRWLCKGRTGKKDITPDVFDDTSSEGKLSAAWVATAKKSSTSYLKISKSISFGVNDLYFLTTITFKNIYGATLYDVMYMRNVDPDQEQPWTNNYRTQNYVAYQPDNDPAQSSRVDPAMPNKALVVAYGNSCNECLLGLGTVHPKARVSHFGFTNDDALQGWKGTKGSSAEWTSYSSSSPRYADEGTNIVFRFPEIAAGASQTFSFAYVLNEADLTKAMNSLTAMEIVQPADTVSGTAAFAVKTETTLAVNSVRFDVSGGSTTTNVGTATTPLTTSDTDGVTTAVYQVTFNSLSFDSGEYTFKALATLGDGTTLEQAKVVRIENDGPRIRFDPVVTGTKSFSAIGTTRVTVVKDTSVSSPSPVSVTFFRELITGDSLRVSSDTSAPYEADFVVDDLTEGMLFTVKAVAVDSAGREGVTTLVGVVSEPNLPPTDISLDSTTVPENSAAGTVIGVLSTSDPNSADDHTYSVSSSHFAILGNTLTVKAGADLDYEVSAKRTRSVTITTTDTAGNTYSKAFTISATNVNEAPRSVSISTSSIAESASINSVVGTLSSDDPDAGQSHTYSLSNDAGGLFRLSGNQVLVKAALDHEGNPSPSIAVVSTDNGSPAQSKEQVIALSVTNVNEKPTSISLSSTSVNENKPANTVVGTFTTADPDAGSSHTYELLTSAPFVIDGNSLRTTRSLNFESEPKFTIQIRASDNGSPTQRLTQTMDINVVDLVEPPVAADAAFSVDENKPEGTMVGTISASDPKADLALDFAIDASSPGPNAAHFRIHACSGIIYVANSNVLNYEAQSSYTLKVTVTGEVTVTVNVVITIKDVNEPPAPADRAVTVNENLAVGTSITGGAQAANDPDSGAWGSVAWSIFEGNDLGHFKIAAANGNVQVNKFALNFEQRDAYTLVLQAKDGGGSLGFMTLDVTIADVNEAPIITSAARTVAENTAIGTDIGFEYVAFDEDGDDVVFDITGGNSGGAFGFKPSFGIGGGSKDHTYLQVAAAINFEDGLTPYTLTVRARDVSGAATTATITVQVTDVVEAPAFTKTTHEVSVTENAATGTVVISALGSLVSDPDAAAVGHTLAYAVASWNTAHGSNHFQLRSSDGQLSVTLPPNYEDTAKFTLMVRVTDNGGLSADMLVNVNVQDVNEAPRLSSGETRTINENTDSGTNVLGDGGQLRDLCATDEDGDAIGYALSGHEGRFSVATITTAGESCARISGNGGLNYEAKPSYELTVTASDSRGLQVAATVTILVGDVNDVPTLSDVTFNVGENSGAGASVGSALSAGDEDLEDTLTYAIVGGNTDTAFAIETVSARVAKLVVAPTVPARLQDLSVSTWSLQVSVTDTFDAVATATITVSLVPQNDPPIVASKTVYVNENSPVGTLVHTMTYTDAENDAVTWALQSGNDGGAFSVEAATGKLKVAKNILNYEGASPQFLLTISATDKPEVASSALSGSAQITVVVQDVNEAPVLGVQLKMSINENTAVGQAVGSPIQGTDQDRDRNDDEAGDWGHLQYRIVSGNAGNAFAINGISGQITVNGPLNHERAGGNEYTLGLEVFDGGNLVGPGSVSIAVLNLNEAPSIPTTTRSVAENSAPGALVGSPIGVVDDDNKETFTWSIVGGDTGGTFAIGASSGQLTVAKPHNFEAKASHSLTLKVVDSGGLQAQGSVTVAIVDVNEAPWFTAQSLSDRFVDENVAIGTNVGSVLVGDDQEDYDTLSFRLSVSEKTFRVDSATGQLSVKAALDHEAVDLYEVEVTVMDNGSPTALATTSIARVWINDVAEAPTADFDGDLLPIDENTAAGTAIGSLPASDVDEGAKLSWRFKDATFDVFTLNADTGVLSVGSPLNFEATPSYTFVVVVSDETGLEDEGTVTVAVQDVNEAPWFTEGSNMARSVDENSAKKTPVGIEIPSADVDFGQLRTYAITGGNDDGIFSINPCSGQIEVARSNVLDHEVQPSYTLQLTLTDDGDSPVPVLGTVVIQVLDLNEAPVVQAFDFTISENSAVATDVGVPVATSDQDEPGDTLTWSIQSGNAEGAFAISATTGQISVAKQMLDFERRDEYDLVIRVTDNGTPVLFHEAPVSVTVVDVNEVCVVAGGSRSINENSAALTSLGAPATATDVDGDGLTFSLTGGSGQAKFAIDPNTGAMVLASGQALDHETAASYTLEVSCTDDGTPSLTGATTLTIVIGDVNEAPVVTANTISINENAAVGSLVGVVLASDVDDGQTLSYAIIDGDTAEHLRVVADADGNCEVRVRLLALDFEVRPQYVITVQATDDGPGALTGTATVTVNLQNVNEAPWLPNTARAIFENSVDGTAAGEPIPSFDFDDPHGDTRTYAITGGSGASVFKVDATSGQLMANGGVLNHEATPSHTVELTVTDAGGLTGTGVVTVAIVNVNEAPVLPDALVSTNERAAENEAVGTPLAVQDVDSSTFTFSIVGNAGPFKIDASTGQLRVAIARVVPEGLTPDADFVVATFTLTVRVEDNGVPSPVQSDTATVTVKVYNLNDPPEAPNRFFTLDENVPIGHVVGSAPSTDKDDNRVSYKLVHGNIDNVFAIDVDTAQITVARDKIDHEGFSLYSLTVEATDDGPGNMKGQSVVNVAISDVNEAPVAFDATMEVDENTPIGTYVGNVRASDPDSGDTEKLTWAITLGNDDGVFKVEDDRGQGRITLAKAGLNFEVNSKRVLTLRCTDGDTATDTATVTVIVNDMNDAPLINYQFREVLENSAKGTAVGSVIAANDPDCCDEIMFEFDNGGPNCWRRHVKTAGSEPTYQWLAAPLATPGFAEFTFTIEGDAWMFMTLSEQPAAGAGQETHDLYEIVIGGWSNTDRFVGIRRRSAAGSAGGQPAKSLSSYAASKTFTEAEWAALNDADNPQPYWLLVEDGTLSLGTGTAVSFDTMVTFNDDPQDYLAVAHVGLSTVNSVPGTWDRLCFDTSNPVGADVFRMDRPTGQLSVKASTPVLNHEGINVFSFLVAVSDDGAGRLTNRAVVEVEVTDVNEQPVVRDVCPGHEEAQVCLTVAENSDINVLVGSPLIVDDQDSADSHSWKIVADNVRGAFAIDAATGQLRVAAAVLDHEDSLTGGVYLLTVLASDSGTQALAGQGVVRIEIADVNEVPTLGNAERSVRENSDSTVTLPPPVVGADVDDANSDWGTLRYSIVGGDGAALFTVEPVSGLLRVASGAALNYESKAEYELHMQATDLGGLALAEPALTKVHVVDINEPPVLEDAALGVDENAAKGAHVGAALEATDEDADQVLIYKITGGTGRDIFSIDPCSGQVLVHQPVLDHEAQDTYTLEVTVTDDGIDPPRLTDTATITITVHDVNEAPVVAPQVREMNENAAAGTPTWDAAGGAARIAVSDQDSAQSHTWTLSGGNAQYTIDANTGVIAVAAGAALDYESKRTYEVVVTALDNGTPALSGSATVTIHLHDVNENPAIAAQQRFVPENSAVDALVGSPLQASDPDSLAVDATWRTWTFSITGGTGASLFKIDPTTGQLAVAQATLNYEGVAEYSVEVTVTDAGPGLLTGSGTVTVALTDVNEAPVIAAQTRHVDENSGVNTVFDTPIVCTDVDGDQTRTYVIVPDGKVDSEIFIIDAISGQLSVKVPELNHEVKSTYTFTVRCTDAGLRPALEATAAITVVVDDVNEAPIMGAFARTIDENQGAGSVVLAVAQGEANAVSAWDEDEGDTVTYAIEGGDGASSFVVDAATGLLTVASGAALDFEAKSMYTVTVRASDAAGLSTAADTTIALVDLNEAPVLPAAMAYFIRRVSPVGTTVNQVVASDEDRPEDPLTYTLTDASGTFRIDADTGVISVAGNSADLEVTQPAYVLAITVADNEGLSDSGQVSISVTDGNNKPQLDDVALSIPENSDVGTLVGAMVFTDGLDMAQQDYTFTITQVDRPFSVSYDEAADPFAPKISVAGPLNFEGTSEYIFDVVVADDHAESLSDSGRVTVTVTDVNEAPSVLQSSLVDAAGNSILFVNEDAWLNTPAGTVVGEVHVADPDTDEKGDVVYSLDAQGAPLEIRAKAGAEYVAELVVSQAGIDYETTPQLPISITVTDSLGLSDTKAATVVVRNMNDAPTVAAFAFDVNEDAPLGTPVGTVTASDPDGTPVTWAITAGDPDNHFQVHPNTGAVTVASQDVDYETQESYSLTIVATDLRVGSDTTVHAVPTTVTITVIDVNDITFTSFIGPGVPHSTRGAQTVYIKGTDFGKKSDPPSVHVTYGANEGADEYTATECVVSVPSTEIKCTSSPGVGGALRWKVALQPGFTAISTITTSYRKPVITALSDSVVNMPTAGGTMVEVTGTDFGNEVSYVTVSYGSADRRYVATDCAFKEAPEVSAAAVAAEEDSAVQTLVCRAAPGVGTELEWRVTVRGLESEAFQHLDTSRYATAEVYSISSTVERFDTSGGDIVVVNGTNFGGAGLETFNGLVVTYGPDSAPTRYRATGCRLEEAHTLVLCHTVPGMGADHTWGVSVGEQDSARSVQRTAYQIPRVLSVSGLGARDASTEGGQEILISGEQFGAGSAASAALSVTYGPAGERFTAAECRVTVDHAAIACKTAPGTGRNHAWFVAVDGQRSPLFEAGTSYANPIISFYEGPGSKDGETEGNEVVVVHGKNFGPAALGNDIVMTYGEFGSGFDASSCVIVQDHFVIECKTAPGAGADYQWSVTIDGQVSEAPTTSYGPPEVHALAGPQMGDAHSFSTYGGEVVNITGNNFGPPEAAEHFLETVTYGATGLEYEAKDCVIDSHTAMHCTTVPGSGVQHSWVVRIAGQASQPSTATTSYAQPQLAETSHTNGPTNGAFEVVLKGYHLGLADPKTEVVVHITGVGGQVIEILGTPDLLTPGGLVQEDDADAANFASGNGRRLGNLLVNGRVVQRPDVFRFSMPEGRGGGKHVRFGVRRSDARSAMQLSDPIVFNYDAPEVTRIVTREKFLDNSPTVLYDVTILGYSFGNSPLPVYRINADGSKTLETSVQVLVTFVDEETGNDMTEEVTDYKLWSHNEINFIREQAGTVVVKTTSLGADGVVRTTETDPETFEFGSPNVGFLDGGLDLTPPPLPTDGSGYVTLYGRNLWAEGIGTNVTVGGENGGQLCTEVTVGLYNSSNPEDPRLPNQFVTARVPEWQGEAVPIVVFKVFDDANVAGSVPVRVNFEQPVITSVSSTSGSAAATSVDVTTGRTDGSSRVTIRGTNLGSQATSMGFQSMFKTFTDCVRGHSEMTCTVPEGEGSDVFGLAYKLEVSVPRMYCSNTAGSTGGAAAANSSVITAEGFNRCDLAFDSDPVTTLRTLVTWPYRYLAPAVVSVTNNLDTAGGVVTIEGHNFGVASVPQVAFTRNGFATLACTATAARTIVAGTSPRQDQLQCTLPEGTGSGWSVLVTVAGLTSSAQPGSFKFAAPAISGLSIDTGVTAGGYEVTVNGANMGGAAFVGDSTSVALGRVEISDHDYPGTAPIVVAATSATHTSVTFAMPEGIGRKNVRVVLDGQASNEVRFDYLPPNITSMTPNELPTSGDTIVTLLGSSFGMAQAVVEVRFPRIERVLQEVDEDGQVSEVVDVRESATVKCKALEEDTTPTCWMRSISHSEVQLHPSPGMGRGNSLRLVVGEGSAAMVSQWVEFHYQPPTITQFVPNIINAEGDTIKIFGDNFGAETSAVQLTLDGVLCPNARWSQDSKTNRGRPFLQCAPPKHLVGAKNISLAVAFQQVGVAAEDSLADTRCYKDFYGRDGEHCLPCPRGADCAGFEAEPVAQEGWYKLKGEDGLGQCHEQRTHRSPNCSYVVPCEPKNACAGANICGTGYRDGAPLFRCSLCANNYYRVAGECRECPKHPWLFVVMFLGIAIVACIAGYLFNSKNVNVAFMSIGVDYFQVLALFANSKVQWPQMVVDIFYFFSIFNLNLEIAAPECSIPDLSYAVKWAFIEGMPVGANVLLFLIYVAQYLRKKCIGRKQKLHAHAPALVATSMVLFYYLYLYITRTVLDVFNCAPTDPPDGKEYLSVVFEPCWQAGGLQMSLLPFAIVALLVYVVGYPTLLLWLLHRNRYRIMEDQLLRAQGMGSKRIENRNAYETRKKYHKLYYQFRPDKYYWILVIIARKFGIAFTALMFNKNPAFQLSMALLVLFLSYVFQVKHVPFMSISERPQVMRDHRIKVEEGDKVHVNLEHNLRDVLARVRKRGTRFSWDARGGVAKVDTAAAYCWNYNTVESVLLFCLVLVCLGGVMFESNRFSTDYFQVQKDIVTVAVLLIIFFSLAYFAVVLFTEIYLMCTEERRAKRARKRSGSGDKRKKGATVRQSVFGGDVEGGGGVAGMGEGIELANNAALDEDAAMNPMFARQGAAVTAAEESREALQARNKALLAEIATLKRRLQQNSGQRMASFAGRRRKVEFGQSRSRGPGARRLTAAMNAVRAVSSASSAAAAGGASGGAAAAAGKRGRLGRPRARRASVVDARGRLPTGWRCAKDPASSRMYYVNLATKETSWERPTAPAIAPAVPSAAPHAPGPPAIPEDREL